MTNSPDEIRASPSAASEKFVQTIIPPSVHRTLMLEAHDKGITLKILIRKILGMHVEKRNRELSLPTN